MIYIIRHGKTEMNKANVLQGRSDIPLNGEGRKQALEAAELLKGIEFERIFSSPLIRAVQTAEIIAPGRNITIDERLIEMDYGPYEGADLKEPTPELIAFFNDFVHNPAPEGMEQLDSVIARTNAFLKAISSLSGNILISTHAIAMKGILENLTPESHGMYWSTFIGNCTVYAAEQEDGWFTVPHEMRA